MSDRLSELWKTFGAFTGQKPSEQKREYTPLDREGFLDVLALFRIAELAAGAETLQSDPAVRQATGDKCDRLYRMANNRLPDGGFAEALRESQRLGMITAMDYGELYTVWDGKAGDMDFEKYKKIRSDIDRRAAEFKLSTK